MRRGTDINTNPSPTLLTSSCCYLLSINVGLPPVHQSGVRVGPQSVGTQRQEIPIKKYGKLKNWQEESLFGFDQVNGW